MKLYVLTCLSLSLLSCASPSARRVRYSPPSVAPLRTSVMAAHDHVTTATARAKAVGTKLTQLEEAVASQPPLLALTQDAHSELDALTQELVQAQTNFAAASGQLNDLEAKSVVQADLLNKAIDDKNAAITQDAIDRRHAHRLKTYACSIAATLAFLVVFHFRAWLTFLGPWGLIAYAAAPLTTFGVVWSVL